MREREKERKEEKEKEKVRKIIMGNIKHVGK